jgi:hypothetical protein
MMLTPNEIGPVIEIVIDCAVLTVGVCLAALVVIFRTRIEQWLDRS